MGILFSKPKHACILCKSKRQYKKLKRQYKKLKRQYNNSKRQSKKPKHNQNKIIHRKSVITKKEKSEELEIDPSNRNVEVSGSLKSKQVSSDDAFPVSFITWLNLNEVECDATHYEYLWKISWLSLLSGTYALGRGYFDLAAVPLGVWLTSINYWHAPHFSWRRNVDMFYVHVSMGYQLYRSIEAEYRKAYWVVLGMAVLCYPVSVFYDKKSPWFSTLLHSGVHIFGNISNFILYSGYIPSVYATFS